ncbi:MAG: hypothetical protein M3P98_04415 [bacterium]|nr:hypothetical protein [bacterium]
MSKTANYSTSIHTQCVSDLINPPTTAVTPNSVLRKMILDSVSTGRKINYTLIAREYFVKTGKKVTRQWVTQLTQKMGVYVK